jgi:hypothetical protein
LTGPTAALVAVVGTAGTVAAAMGASLRQGVGTARRNERGTPLPAWARQGRLISALGNLWEQIGIVMITVIYHRRTTLSAGFAP